MNAPYFRASPTAQEVAEYEALVIRSAEWQQEGRCMSCGAADVELFGGHCAACVNVMWEDAQPENQ